MSKKDQIKICTYIVVLSAFVFQFRIFYISERAKKDFKTHCKLLPHPISLKNSKEADEYLFHEMISSDVVVD